MNKKENRIYFIFIIIGLIAFSYIINAYRRSKVNFYVEQVDQNLVYHISLDCKKIKDVRSLSKVKEFFFTMNPATACKSCNKSYTKIN